MMRNVFQQWRCMALAALVCVGVQAAERRTDLSLLGTANRLLSGADFTVMSGGDFVVASGGTFTLASGSTVTFGAPLSMANGGLGVALTDPGADRLLFWDDSAGFFAHLTLGTGISITGTTINATGTGDVVGPASSTDNALARFDSTTGKLVQNSTTTLSDAGAFAFADGVKQTFNPDGTTAGFNVGSHATDPSSPANGDMWYDSGNNTLDARINGATVNLGAGGGGGSGSITASGYTMTTARLLGRSTASTGAVEEITVGSGLTLSGGNLTASGGGGSGTLTLMRWDATMNEAPSSAAATFDTRNSQDVYDFDASSAESAVFSGIIPEAADFTTGIAVRVIWSATSATTDEVIWTTAFERGDTDSDSDSFATGIDSTASTTSATSGIKTTTVINHTGSEIDGLLAGESFRLKITRKAADAGDDMAGDAEVHAVEIRQR